MVVWFVVPIKMHCKTTAL